MSGGGQYSLVVTCGSEFDIEPNTGPNEAEWLTPAESVLGSLGRTEQEYTAGTIRVALLSSGEMTADVQLADDTYFDFDPVLVNASQIDTVGELNAFDVVVIGDHLSHSQLVTVAPALRAWVESGGGVVGVGWVVYAAGNTFGYIPDIDAIIPVQTPVSHTYYSNAVLTISDSSHPVTQGVSNFTASGYTEYSSTARTRAL